ncbi:MAG: peptidoglycan recognition family protein, partial [Cyanobacteria bacterium P01_F01_bin.3]
ATDDSPPTVPKAEILRPVVPAFELADNLPTLTPEETRFTPTASFQTEEAVDLTSASAVDLAFNSSNPDEWSSDLSWEAFEYVTPADNQYRIKIDPSNYGDRYAEDVSGNPVQNEILVVLHETTSSAESAVHTFLTHHPDGANQVSYHALILLDGRIVHLVPPEKRAYGAGNSEFRSDQGVEAVQTNPQYPSSVNNFAYHISLETPLDAQNRSVESHSGYSLEQYKSLSWLIRELQVDASRVTTHKAVDRGQERADPRSFDMAYLASMMY